MKNIPSDGGIITESILFKIIEDLYSTVITTIISIKPNCNQLIFWCYYLIGKLKIKLQEVKG
jgi:hypothetical protein